MDNELFDINKHTSNIGPHRLKIFDEDPGERIIEKGIALGRPGALIGAIAGSMAVATQQPRPHLSGALYAAGKMGAAAVVGGAVGFALGVGVPLAQKARGKNDEISWGLGGSAAGVVFGVLRGGKLRYTLQLGALVGLAMVASKYGTDTCKETYVDPYKHLRGPIKYNKLFHEDGSIITYTQK